MLILAPFIKARHRGRGFWSPNPADLKRIREEIPANDQELRDFINHKDFKNTFDPLLGDQVKSAPKDYSKDHPAIDLFKYKPISIDT